MHTDAFTLSALVVRDTDADVRGWVRRVLPVVFLVVGVLVTIWILAQLGPVAYGLPAPFFRRPPIGG